MHVDVSRNIATVCGLMTSFTQTSKKEKHSEKQKKFKLENKAFTMLHSEQAQHIDLDSSPTTPHAQSIILHCCSDHMRK